MFHEPMHVVEEKFTKSDLAVIAWRSQETYFQTKQKIGTNKYPGTAAFTSGRVQRVEVPGASIPEGLPDRFFNQEGELDLRQVTAKDAWNFFKAQGILLPVVER